MPRVGHGGEGGGGGGGPGCPSRIGGIYRSVGGPGRQDSLFESGGGY